METVKTHPLIKTKSSKALWTGRILTALSILFLLFDSISKIVKESHSIEGTVQLGWPEHFVPVIGMILLAFTIVHIIPRTSVFGAILVTAYLGGATATMIRAGEPFFFPIIMAVFVWGGLYLRDERLRKIIPFRNNDDL